MMKFTFHCQLYKSEQPKGYKPYSTKMVVVAGSLAEAKDKLQKLGHSKIHYYSSNVETEEVTDMDAALIEQRECEAALIKKNSDALGILIGLMSAEMGAAHVRRYGAKTDVKILPVSYPPAKAGGLETSQG